MIRQARRLSASLKVRPGAMASKGLQLFAARLGEIP